MESTICEAFKQRDTRAGRAGIPAICGRNGIIPFSKIQRFLQQHLE